MNVNAFGLAAGWKLCAKMRFVPSLHIVFRYGRVCTQPEGRP
jgi:hypothetical protein